MLVKRHNWSKEDCLLVINGFVNGESEEVIADKIGTSVNSVILTKKNLIAILDGKTEGFGSNTTQNQKEAVNEFLDDYKKSLINKLS